MTAKLPRILIVDDDPSVLEGLSRQLGLVYEIVTAEDGRSALDILREDDGFAVILSDMRMSGCNGIALLHEASQLCPDTVRMLLTGNADMETALAAINEGRIFRYLTKPCPPTVLRAALSAAVKQYQLITAERELLEKTLHGSVRALADTLALVSPVAFGRATRLKRRASAVAEQLGVVDRWQIEVAATLSQIGMAILPAETLEKLLIGERPDPEQEKVLDGLPQVTDRILADIPRLEPVREMILHSGARFDGGGARWPAGEAIPLGARILKVVIAYDAAEARGLSADDALNELRTRVGSYDPGVIDALCEALSVATPRTRVYEVPLHSVRLGMRFADDVRTRTGLLLIAKGFEVNFALLERIRHIHSEGVAGPVRITLPPCIAEQVYLEGTRAGGDDIAADAGPIADPDAAAA